MNNRQYIKAYQTSEHAGNLEKSSHEIIRSLIFELVNSMEKVIIDIHDNQAEKLDYPRSNNISKKDFAKKKSKNLSKALSIIYGLQTCLDFDKSPEIAGNLFQLYEYARQQIISSFSQGTSDGIIKASQVIKEILDGWEKIPSEAKKI